LKEREREKKREDVKMRARKTVKKHGWQKNVWE
jgi:hypothetical protein